MGETFLFSVCTLFLFDLFLVLFLCFRNGEMVEEGEEEIPTLEVWQEHYNEDGTVYYYNKANGEFLLYDTLLHDHTQACCILFLCLSFGHYFALDCWCITILSCALGVSAWEAPYSYSVEDEYTGETITVEVQLETQYQDEGGYWYWYNNTTRESYYG